MDSEKWQKIKKIFNAAVELAPAEREAFLQNQSKAGADILAEARKLLSAENVERFEKPFVNIAHLWQDDAAEDFVGRQIGEYKILREIGRGGMGIVFEARRETADFSQIVALKLLKRGMDSDQMLRRFRHERQILASLEHPNIARLLDGGVTENNLSFLAMEFVDGKPLDEFCAENHLSIAERLRLFMQICAAVSFAHSRLVVHRDLKPGNIFVTKNGTSKLLDFGIAKIVIPEENPISRTVTTLGMMTPAYASPEQIRGEIVSTSSDIYSLGLILYELLTGVSAYDFPNKRPDEIARVICETEPPRPSSAVSKSKNETESFTNSTRNQNKRTSSKYEFPNPKSLRGDLDNIVLKALRKEPARRYASVEQFAGDIRRHLEGLPVIARPDTFSYRFEKFVKRNRIYVMAGFLILLTLIGGIAATGWQAHRAEKQRRAADERFRQVRELANNIVFKYYDEAAKLPNSTRLREMFVKDSLAYFDSLAKDENADDNLRIELGRAFLQIAKVQGRAVSPNLGETAGAIENYRKGIEILEPLVANSSDAALQTELVNGYADYGAVLNQSGNASEAATVFQKMIRAGEQFTAQNPADAKLASRLAIGYLFWGDSLPVGENENIAVYKKALVIYENLVEKNPDDLNFNTNLAATAERIANASVTLAKAAREDENLNLENRLLQEAETLLERNVRIGEKLVRLYPNQILPPAVLASAELYYGTLLIESEDYARALETIRKAEKFYRASLEMDQTSVGQKLEISVVEQKLALIYSRSGKIVESEKAFARALEMLDFLIDKDAENFDYLKMRGEAKFDYADEILRRGETEKARQIYKAAFEEMLETAKEKDARFAASLPGAFYEKLGNCWLAESKTKNSNVENAVAEYRKALEIWQQFGARTISGIEQKDKPDILRRKIERLEQTLK